MQLHITVCRCQFEHDFTVRHESKMLQQLDEAQVVRNHRLAYSLIIS